VADELKREVRGVGPAGGIVIVGEAPSWDELREGIPFVGPAGKVLRSHIRTAGIDISGVRLENVIERKLDGNDIGSISMSELCNWREDLVQRLEAVKARVVVACGDTALQALCPGHKIGDAQCYVLDRGNYLVVPAYHPAFIFRQPDWGHWLTWALKKAQKLVTTPSLRTPRLEPKIRPSCDEAIAWLRHCRGVESVSIDIEKTLHTHEITCIGLATSATDVLTIPFADKGLTDYWTSQEEAQVWLELKETLEAPNEKIFQNFIFDALVLRHAGLPLRGKIYDTLIAGNLLNPELPKGLADLARLHLYCAPWKSNKDYHLTGNVEDFWAYNATDAAYTFAIATDQKEWLQVRKLSDFHEVQLRPLMPLVLDTCSRGIRVDQQELQTLDSRITEALKPVLQTLKEIGDPLVPPKRVKRRKNKEDYFVEKPQEFNPASPKQVKEVLATLGYRIPTKDGKETTDRSALLKLNRKNPHAFIAGLLSHSRLAKLKSSYTQIHLDEDGRCRFSYNIAGTKSGRFSASATPWDTGLNIQTVPRKDPTLDLNLRRIFIPDPGMQLLQVDLSQAELRVVAWLARDEKLTRLLEEKQDVHQFVADEVQRISGLNCPRQLGKRINHAANYGMGADKFADSCLVEADLALSVQDAQRLLDARARAFPAIPLWHRSIEATVRKTRRLCSPHGRERFFYGLLNSETFREALSFIPQATVVDTLNAAWRDLAKSLEYNKTFNVLQQGHDSLLIQVQDGMVDSLVSTINTTFGNQHHVIHGDMKLIPWDIAVGPTWGDLKPLC
jgi:uracil-DNA glycosylase family 4